MNKKLLFSLWAVLFILCAGLGFIPEPAGAVKTILFLLSLIFFLPPMVLLFLSVRDSDKETLLLVRNLSILSLLATLVFMMLNIASVLWSQAAGNILYSILTIVSSPMICCGNWFLSMFLWACLLMISLRELKKANKNPG